MGQLDAERHCPLARASVNLERAGGVQPYFESCSPALARVECVDLERASGRRAARRSFAFLLVQLGAS
jgi:hypothetical protein